MRCVFRAASGFGAIDRRESTIVNLKGGRVSIWLVILIIVLLILAFGGFGYSRR